MKSKIKINITHILEFFCKKDRVYIFLFILILFIVLLFCIVSNVLKNFKMQNTVKSNYNYVMVDNNYIIEKYKNKFDEKLICNKVNQLIKDRYILINDKSYEILIGNNKKELENGYFDIRLFIFQNSLNIYINKLFKNNLNSASIYESIYLDELVNLLLYVLEFSLKDADIKRLKENIRSDYINIRDVENVDKKDYEIIDKCFIFDNLKLEFDYENNMLKISL